MRITLPNSGSPGEHIRAQLHGYISTGRLIPGERLPSVRQLASDLGVAPGTVAKVYRTLEDEGLIVTRIGSGTRVAPHAHSTPPEVLEQARALVSACDASGVGLEECLRTVQAMWEGAQTPTSEARQ